MRRFLIPDLIRVVAEYADYFEAVKLRLPVSNFRVRSFWVTVDNQRPRQVTHIDGQLVREEEWHDHGLQTKRKNWRHGQLHGKQIFWNDDGSRHRLDNWKHGTQEGKQYWWWSNGIKSCECFYIAGLRSGTQYHWRQNGKPYMVVGYLNDRQHGKFTAWNKWGWAEYKKTYEHGSLKPTLLQRFLAKFKRPELTLDDLRSGRIF